MRADPGLERVVASWLKEDGREDADRVLFTVLNQLDATQQRHAGWLARRFPIVNNTNVRYGIAAAAVILVAVVAWSYLPNSNTGGPGPTPSPTPRPTATSSPTPTPSTLPAAFGSELDAGTYTLPDTFPVPVSFDVEDGWAACSESPTEQNICRPGAGISFVIVENVVARPCELDGPGLEPAIGRSVNDLVSAITELEGFESTDQVDVTVNGFSGTRFELTAPAEASCDGLGTWMTASRTTVMGPGERNLLQIMNAGGVRVLIAAAYDPSNATEAAEIQRIMDSVEFER